MTEDRVYALEQQVKEWQERYRRAVHMAHLHTPIPKEERASWPVYPHETEPLPWSLSEDGEILDRDGRPVGFTLEDNCGDYTGHVFIMDESGEYIIAAVNNFQRLALEVERLERALDKRTGVLRKGLENAQQSLQTSKSEVFVNMALRSIAYALENEKDAS